MRRRVVILVTVVLVAASATGVSTYVLLQHLLQGAGLPLPGELALQILQPEPYGGILVEVDWAVGMEPSEVALGVLQTRLVKYTFKNVQVLMSDAFETNSTSFGPGDLLDTRDAYRDVESNQTVIALHVLYLPGHLAEGEGSLAVSYLGDSIAVFKEAIRKVSRTSRGITTDDIEASALVHELGHLFGLVNIVYESEVCDVQSTAVCIFQDGRWTYEDQDHPFHSLNRSDVMFWALEATPFLAERPPTDFGFETRYDIEKLREGGYATFPSRLRSASKAYTPIVSVSPSIAIQVSRPIYLCRLQIPVNPLPWLRASS